MKLLKINDKLQLYNKYTNAYRLDDSLRYKDFSPYSPFNVASILDFVKRFNWEGNRAKLCTTLDAYAQNIGASMATQQNIAKLQAPNTFAVVSGHQPSLLGGPLFVMLKLASLIALTNSLNQATTDFNFVPLFWIASEDHNLAEYNSFSVYNQANDLITVKIPGEFDQTMAACREPLSVQSLEDIFSLLPTTEFTASIKEEVKQANTGNLGRLFSRLINTWFARYGIITIEPNYLRELSAPVLSWALQEHPDLVANMGNDCTFMHQEGFPLQLPPPDLRKTFLFYLDHGQRYRIVYNEAKFCVPELKKCWDKSEILTRLQHNPELFSTTAGLRPIVQGSILPAPVYLAGGGELAYHLQLRNNFEAAKVTMPLLVPRAVGSIITPSIKRLLASFSWPCEQILTPEFDWSHIESTLLRANNTINTAFLNYFTNFTETSENLLQELHGAGSNQLKDLENEFERFKNRVEKIQARLANKTSNVGGSAKEKFYKLQKYLLPANKYQELSISSLYFYNLIGTDFFDMIVDIDVLTNDHKLWIIE